jgi:hypothetical protein
MTPGTLLLPWAAPLPVLAPGAHLKNTAGRLASWAGARGNAAAALSHPASSESPSFARPLAGVET